MILDAIIYLPEEVEVAGKALLSNGCNIQACYTAPSAVLNHVGRVDMNVGSCGLSIQA